MKACLIEEDVVLFVVLLKDLRRLCCRLLSDAWHMENTTGVQRQLDLRRSGHSRVMDGVRFSIDECSGRYAI